MGGRGRAQSMGAPVNSKAQLIAAYNELGKELSDTRMRVVGNYNIGRVIGEGSYGKVRIGTHRLMGTRVALKQIPKSVSAQLTREIHHHRQLHHPHVVQLYEVIATETSIWLVTELCAGGELFDYLVEKGRLDELEARALFGQLCLAVAYCHDQGVVHRDLKLENVLLDDYCQVKLSDFGFTREFERGSLLETFCGTTGYASPEMLIGQKYLGQEVDIWSLGIILYALLTGGLPFDDDDEQEMKNKILAGEFEDPEWLSPEARELITGILVQDPLKRLSMRQILSSSWFSKKIDPSSPLTADVGLPPISAVDTDAAEISRPPSIIMERSRLSTSSNPPGERPTTPLNHINGIADENSGLKGTDVETDASPGRIIFERKNSSTSIAPPLPTRTPVRTKRRSVSSTISPPTTPKIRPSSMVLQTVEQVDFAGAMTKQTAIVFSTPQERAILTALAALGLDTGQIVHSVLSNACDSAGALWWIMRKKLGKTTGLPDEQSGSTLAVADPFSDSALSGKVVLDIGISEEEGEEALEINGGRPTILLGEVDESKKKRGQRTHREHAREQADRDPPEVIPAATPDFAIVPATPIVAEEPSKAVETSPTASSLSPTHVPSSLKGSSDGGHEPVHASIFSTSSKISSGKNRSGSISMLQRATTVLGGAASLVRKKSEENSLANKAGSVSSGRDKEKSGEEPRSSSGSGGRLTKSPPPGKVSKESKEREREGSADMSTVGKSGSTGTPSPATHPGRVKALSPPSAFLSSNITRRSITEGGRPISPMVNRELTKPRNRGSILSTFRTWFDDGRRKRKTGSSFSTPFNSPAGGLMATSPSAPAMTGYFPGDSSNPSFPDRPYTPRKRSGSGKGTAPRRGGRGGKDKRQSISSRRSSSVNSRRSSVGSMASIPNVGTLGSVGEYTVYNGAPLARRQSGSSKQSYGQGAKTPIDEDLFSPSRPDSAKSMTQRAPPVAGIARMGKRHSKSSSTSSGGSLGRTRASGKSNRPPSRSETKSPTNGVGRIHRREGSSSSQTKVVKQQTRKVPSVSKNIGTASETPVLTAKTRHGRSDSVGSVQSGGSSVLDEEGEFGGRRATSPINRQMRTVHIAQKKQSAYGAPTGSLGYGAGRSSWKKSWGLEPPGWANRAANQSVIVEILDARNPKGGIRDVFAGGGKSGVAPGSSPQEESNDDDWSDVEDEGPYAGGLGQLGSGHTPTTNPGSPGNVNAPDSPLMVFSHSNAGRRTKRVAGNLALPAATLSGGSPLPMSSPLPVTPTGQPSVLGMDGMGVSRRQLPPGRSGFRGPAIVEEEEEEEE